MQVGTLRSRQHADSAVKELAAVCSIGGMRACVGMSECLGIGVDVGLGVGAAPAPAYLYDQRVHAWQAHVLTSSLLPSLFVTV